MKKSCVGCRALASYGCDLGKKTEVTNYSRNGHINERKPLEECDKPKTYSYYLHLKSMLVFVLCVVVL